MRFTALLFLAVLTGALVRAYDPEAASAPGWVNPSHEASAVTKGNAESPQLAQKTPKPSRKQRSSLLEKGKEGAEKATKELGDLASRVTEDLINKGK
ncbi:dermcidin isoform 1 preproprotein, partial [Daubentonia madagascariensis]